MSAGRTGATAATAGQLALELPLELPATRASRPSGRTSSACGATRSTRCARTSRASRRPSPTRSSPATRGPATSSSTRSRGRGTTPLQACAEGRIGVGNDLNPFAHLLTAAKVEPATRAEATTRLAALRLAWPPRPPAWLALGERVVADATAEARVPRRRLAAPVRRPATRPSRPRSPSPSIPRTLGQLLFVRDVAPTSTTGPTASSPPRSPGSSTARARATSRSSCRTRSAWRRATSATSRRGRSSRSPERDVFDGLAAKLDRLYRQPPPPAEGVALLGDARDVAPRAREPPCASAACRIGPGSSSRRRPTCGS